MGDVRSASPTSDVFSDAADSLSMRDKSLLKRSASKHHNNNFKAGYVPVHEQYLKKTGLRGRKSFAFWTLVGMLFLLAVGNLLLTMTILGVLRLGQGMESLELVPEYYAVKFFGHTDLDHIYKRDGLIEGFEDEPIEILGQNGSISLNLVNRNGRAMEKWTIQQNGSYLKNFDSFDIKNHDGKTIFSTSSPNLNILKPMKNIDTKLFQTNRIVSPSDKNLEIDSKMINLKGSEGTSLEGKEIIWSADQDIYLKTINGSLVLSGKEGIFIDFQKIPVVTAKSSSDYFSAQYKVCVCMPQGKLFRIPVPNNPNARVYCNHISSAHNPCM